MSNANKPDIAIVKNFVNGCFTLPIANKYIDSINPSTGRVHAQIPDSDKEDVDLAVKSAKTAFSEWSVKSAQFRSKILLQIASILESHAEEFAHLESEDQGKPVTLAAKVDIPRAIYNFRFFATSILHDVNTSTQLEEPVCALNYVERMPIGVAGLISPWNLPMYLLTWKIAPAIAFGNTCVAKPSEMTSLTAHRFAELLQKTDLPSGVINFVFGTGPNAGEPIVMHKDVKLISFTGSTAVGQRIMEKSAPLCKKLSLELGGKNAAIIFEDADIDNCIATTIRSSFANQGEVCLCSSRIYVQSKIYDKFVKKFVDAAKNIKVGDPKDPATNMGALISEAHMNKVKKYIDIAIKDGGTIHCGEGVQNLNLPNQCQSGYFVLPTVITGLTDSSLCMQDEIFGPVACIMPFDTEFDVVTRANNVSYGLCAVVWTKDLSRAHRVSKKLNVGTVWVNCWLVRDLRMPFGGTKMSGVGRESQEDSLDFFTEKKCVCIKY